MKTYIFYVMQVYGRNKEQFGWPEENEDPSACPSTSKVAQVSNHFIEIFKFFFDFSFVYEVIPVADVRDYCVSMID